MNKLVRNLLTLNQLESGRDEMTVERFDIVTLIRGVLQSMDIMTSKKRQRSALMQKSLSMYGQMNLKLKKS